VPLRPLSPKLRRYDPGFLRLWQDDLAEIVRLLRQLPDADIFLEADGHEVDEVTDLLGLGPRVGYFTATAMRTDPDALSVQELIKVRLSRDTGGVITAADPNLETSGAIEAIRSFVADRRRMPRWLERSVPRIWKRPRLFFAIAGVLLVPGTGSWSAAQYWLGQAAGYNSDQDAALRHYTAASDALETDPPSPALALALAGQASMLNLSGRHREGRDVAARALALARDVGDRRAEAFALLSMSQAVHLDDQRDQAVWLARQASQIDPADIPGDFARDCHTLLTMMLTETGDLDGARDSCADLLSLSRQAGDLPSEAVGLYLLADLDVRAGRLIDAWTELRRTDPFPGHALSHASR
jgi:tetratricopeptide (TPR) repeat protein